MASSSSTSLLIIRRTFSCSCTLLNRTSLNTLNFHKKPKPDGADETQQILLPNPDGGDQQNQLSTELKQQQQLPAVDVDRRRLVLRMFDTHFNLWFVQPEDAVHKELTEHRLAEFVAKFNVLYEGTGYRIEHIERVTFADLVEHFHSASEETVKENWSTFYLTLLVALFVYLYRRVRVAKTVLEEPAIAYGQFVGDYLATDKVWRIIYLRHRHEAIAILRPFNIWSWKKEKQLVRVDVSPELHGQDIRAFVRLIRQAEAALPKMTKNGGKKSASRKPVPIYTVDIYFLWFCATFTAPLLTFFCVTHVIVFLWKRFMMQYRFRCVRREGPHPDEGGAIWLRLKRPEHISELQDMLNNSDLRAKRLIEAKKLAQQLRLMRSNNKSNPNSVANGVVVADGQMTTTVANR